MLCSRLATGDYVTPQFNAQPRFDKPILIYWLMALSVGILFILLNCVYARQSTDNCFRLPLI